MPHIERVQTTRDSAGQPPYSLTYVDEWTGERRGIMNTDRASKSEKEKKKKKSHAEAVGLGAKEASEIVGWLS